MTHWPYFAQDEIDVAVDTLKSGKVNYWTGEQCKLFEKEFAEFFGVKHAIALMNGTVALEAALHALNIGVGDDVIVTSRTFIASASAAVMRGARPVIADVDRHSQNITVESIKAVMTPNTKAIVCVHLAGWPCEMDKIMAFAKEHNLFVIEDCAQSHGAKYKNQYAGTFGDIGAFSFCQDKIMTTGGEGGMVVTNNEILWKKMWAIKEHGKDFDTVFNRAHPPGFRWLHQSFGTNWRMTEMQAAIGRQQLKKLPEWIEKRNHFSQRLNKAFSAMPAFRTTLPGDDIVHAYYKYYVFIKLEELRAGWTRDKIIQAINDQGVACFSGSCSEIYLEHCFQVSNLAPESRLNVAKELGETSLMFLVHPTLNDQEISRAISVVSDIMKNATDTR